MNLFAAVKSQLLEILAQLRAEGLFAANLAFDAVDVMPPREASHGDMATNAAMVLAAKAGLKPRELAEAIAAQLRILPSVADISIAGPGFINLHFTPLFWQEHVAVILKEGIEYGTSQAGKGQRVNVEYVSANPTGPMHVGHGRGAVYGDALASLLVKAGYEVTREYYINDGGAQVDMLADSVFLRYREALGETLGDIPEGLYPGDYLLPVGRLLAETHGRALLDMPKAERLPLIRDVAMREMMALIRADLAQMHITHDVFTSERALTESKRIEEALGVLDAKNLIYTGVLEAPKGKTPDDWEARPQLLFRSTAYGDDVDRPIQKSDGSWTYFAPDIACHYDKVKRGYTKLVDVMGADHGGYAKRIQAAVAALSENRVPLEVKLCQLVKFLRGGEPVKMSKRKGTFLTVREVVDEVGNGVFRFIMLTRKNDVALDFDFAKVTEQSKENPVFYVQYAYARSHSLFKMAREEVGIAVPFAEHPAHRVLILLDSPAELELIRLLASYPRHIEMAAAACEPHRIAFYLQEVAAAFHALWNLGNHDAGLRFIQKENVDLTAARLALVHAAATVIGSGLKVLGIEPLEELR